MLKVQNYFFALEMILHSMMPSRYCNLGNVSHMNANESEWFIFSLSILYRVFSSHFCVVACFNTLCNIYHDFQGPGVYDLIPNSNVFPPMRVGDLPVRFSYPRTEEVAFRIYLNKYIIIDNFI